MQHPRRSVLVVYTGGTFGMHETAQGLAPDPGFLAPLRAMTQDLLEANAGSTLEATVVATQQAIDSSNAGPETAPALAALIRAHASQLDGLAGVVAIHGTDTLAYSAARLAFELHDLGAPLVVTGSQLPYAAAGSDAHGNLALALAVITTPSCASGVWVAFADRVLPAIRATKYSSTHVDGFRAALPVAPDPAGVPPLPTPRRASPSRVVSMRFTPGVIAADVAAVHSTSPDGVILETYGAGNAPVSREGMRTAIERLAEHVPVVAISQCMTGGVQLGRYAPGHELAALGVIDGADLTLEAALGKLAFLLDRSVPQPQIEALMRRNFVGECRSPRVS